MLAFAGQKMDVVNMVSGEDNADDSCIRTGRWSHKTLFIEERRVVQGLSMSRNLKSSNVSYVL